MVKYVRKRKYKRPFRKTRKSYSRPRRRAPRRRSLRRAPIGGFPQAKYVRLRYVEHVTMDPGADLLVRYSFRANSLYDPNHTGVGHQPAGFDEWMERYNHYTVLGSKMTAQFINPGETHLTPGYAGIILTANETDASSFTSIDNLLESRLSTKFRPAGLVLGNTNSTTILKSMFSAKKFFHISKATMVGNTAYSGTSGSDPTEGAYFSLCYASINGNNPEQITVRVSIDYYAVFTEPKILLGS